VPPDSQIAGVTSATDVLWANAERHSRFESWLAGLSGTYGLQRATLRAASADASFRRYLRIDGNGSDGMSRSLIIMDAPPDKENSAPFVKVADLMRIAGLRVPEILSWDASNGFMLLSDLGAQTMMQIIDPATPPLDLYLQATDILVQWQLASRAGVLPAYDHALLSREVELYPQWYVAQHRNFTLDTAQRKTLDEAFACILQNNLGCPSVYVHRDFMPRNLMVSREGLGVLDFQDAVYGPITYDIASLMRDAFLSWEEDFCLDVTIRYWEKARKAGLPVGDDFGEFYRGVEWMGLQRHLKVTGIFARLTLRDGKPQYLADTPRFIHYMRSTCERYRELKPLLRLIEKIDGIEIPNVFAFGRT
jgi:aminoglycoside/choline kinase family phosphotransferase